MFCLIFSLNSLAFEKVDVTGAGFATYAEFTAKVQEFLAAGLGTSGTEVTVVDGTPVVSIYGTSSAVTGTLRDVVVNYEVGAAGAANVEALYVNVDSEYATGSWTNAIVGRIDYGLLGSASGGMAASICAEMNLAPIASPGGSYYNVHSYFNVPTGATLIDSTAFNYAFERYESLDPDHEFDLYGLLWHIVGLDDATTKILYNNTLKIQIDTTKWYIPLSSAEGSYTTAYPIVSTYGGTAISVASTLAGAAADDCVSIVVNDTTTLAAAAYSRSLYISHTNAGIKSGNGEGNGLGIDIDATANVTSLYGISLYSGTMTGATINRVAGIYTYMDEPVGTVNAISCLHLETAAVSGTTNDFISIRAHGLQDSIIASRAGGAAATHFLDFTGVFAPVEAFNAAGNGDYSIKCYINGETTYIHTYDAP